MGISLPSKDALYSRSGDSSSNVAWIWPIPPVGPAVDLWFVVVKHAFCIYLCYSDVLRSNARSCCPHRLANVSGVSPSAFLTWVLAPHITRNLAISSFGAWPHTRCRAVSPLVFCWSRSALFWFRKYMSSLLPALAAMWRRELFQFSLSLKSITLAPCISMFFNSSNLPSWARDLIESLFPFFSSTCSYISLVSNGSKQ